eukprot:53678-Prorocentrum_minimum.AAC.5
MSSPPWYRLKNTSTSQARGGRDYINTAEEGNGKGDGKKTKWPHSIESNKVAELGFRGVRVSGL